MQDRIVLVEGVNGSVVIAKVTCFGLFPILRFINWHDFAHFTEGCYDFLQQGFKECTQVSKEVKEYIESIKDIDAIH